MRSLQVNKSKFSNGFTIVELAVVFPIVAIVVGILIVVLVNLVVNNADSRSLSNLTYDAQASIDLIERDATYAAAFLPIRDNSVTDPYESSSPTGSWTFHGQSANYRTLIIRAFATTKAPQSEGQALVYKKSATQDCPNISSEPLTYNIIYFVQNNNLYRRTVFANNAPHCSTPYQKHSCPIDIANADSACQINDSILARNVTKFQVDYFNSPNTSATPLNVYTNPTDLSEVVSVKIKLESSSSLSGKEVKVSRTLPITKLNSIEYSKNVEVIARDIIRDLNGHWKFNGNAMDSTNYARHGSVSGATLVPGQSGGTNRAYHFSNLGDVITIPTAPPATTSLSLSVWVRPTHYPTAAGTLNDKAAIIRGQYYLSLHLSGALASFWNGTSPAGYHITNEGVIPLNQWSHLVTAWDGSKLSQYVNGSLLNTVTVSGTGSQTASSLRIGSENTQRQFYGSIDDVRIYGRTLSQADVLALYLNGAQ